MSEVEYFSHFISDGKGKLLEIPQRRGKQDGVFVDWISFTFHEDTLLKVSGCPLF
ncbi:TPA: Replication initiation factor family protein, partial [Neisseria meningitidis]